MKEKVWGREEEEAYSCLQGSRLEDEERWKRTGPIIGLSTKTQRKRRER